MRLFWPNRMRLLATVLALGALAIAGCGGNDNDLVLGSQADVRVASQPTGSAAENSDAPPWVNADGNVVLKDIPPMIQVYACEDPGRDPKDCVGFVDSAWVYPELQAPTAPVNAVLGYQPGPGEVTNTDGEIIGYFVPDVGFVAVEHFDASRHGTPEKPIR